MIGGNIDFMIAGGGSPITGNIPPAWLGTTGTTAAAGNDARITGAAQLAAANVFTVGPQKITSAVAATSQYGSLSIGGGPWDGVTAGFYNSGNASGTVLAINAAAGFSGSGYLINAQLAGSRMFSVDGAGNAVVAGNLSTVGDIVLVNTHLRNGTAFWATAVIRGTSNTAPVIVFEQQAAQGTQDMWTYAEDTTHAILGGMRYDGLIYATHNTAAHFSGLATVVKAGTPADTDWATAPPDGTIAGDSTGSKIWIRLGAVWKSVAVA